MILYHLSRGAHHVLFAMENMEIMDYMAHGTAKMGISSLMILNLRSCIPKKSWNIVLPATVQAINSSLRS